MDASCAFIRLKQEDRESLKERAEHQFVKKKEKDWSIQECLHIIEVGWNFMPYVPPKTMPKAAPKRKTTGAPPVFKSSKFEEEEEVEVAGIEYYTPKEKDAPEPAEKWDN